MREIMMRMPGKSLLGLSVLLVCCAPASALNPSLEMNQYAHTAWKIREGFVKGDINSIAQTSDGYLWLGTDFGLVRFDGVRMVSWEPPTGRHLPSSRIFSLLAARNGALWIGTTKGLVSWKGNQLTQYRDLAGQNVHTLVEDREGTVWVGSVGLPPGGLCAIRNGGVRCFGGDGSLGNGVEKLYEDSKGTLWASTSSGIWRWKPGPAHFYAYPLPSDTFLPGCLTEDTEGGILIGTPHGVVRLIDGKIVKYPLPGSIQDFPAESFLRDRDGALWIGTSNRGLLHVHGKRTDLFSSSDGFSGGMVADMFEDREGDVWVSGSGGLDRFRDFAVATIATRNGLASGSVFSVLPDKEGTIWFSTSEGLDRLDKGQVSHYAKREQSERFGPGPLFQDDRGRIWLPTRRELGYLEQRRFVPVRSVPRGLVVSMTEDTGGDLWGASEDFGLVRLRQGNVVQQIAWVELGHKDPATAVVSDPVRGGLWLGFSNGGVGYFAEGKLREFYTAANGLGNGRVNNLRIGRHGMLWASTDGGLSRFNNGHFATLSGKSGLPCDAVYWAMEDDDGSFWLYMPCGLVRILRSEIDAWAAAADKNQKLNQTMQLTVFDSSDGVRTLAETGIMNPKVAKSADGRLWFLPWDGVSIVDPHRLSFNGLPPPLHIEQVRADRQTYDPASTSDGRLRLPQLVRDLEIDYTALSLVAPEKVRFKYELEGYDRDWQDAGNRRQAFYNNLSPRGYRFRVIACNNSGVWNEAGAFLDFSIAPAYYQTFWFRASCVIAFLALLWGLYRYRLHQIAQVFNARLEERVSERTRLARDLHDTLLQGFQGLILRLQAAEELLPPGRVKEQLEQILERADQAIAEGRRAVYDLRSSTATTNDLAQAITAVGDELAGEGSPTFSLVVEGPARDLHPILRDEVYRIAREGLCNAFSHAQAHRVEAEITYAERLFRLRIRDDGNGIAPAILEVGRPGHYGLRGMRERARQVGAKLEMWSGVGTGTEIDLSIPASIAYSKSPMRSRLRLFRSNAG